MSTGNEIDLLALTTAWSELWRGCRPLGHELRDCARDRWVRFHSLPESKRYAESAREQAEVLRRHNALLEELHSTTPQAASLLVITCSWGFDGEPVPREPALESVAPRSIYWQSVLREADGDEEFWVHLFVGASAWRVGELDQLLRLIAEDRTADVIITEPGLGWLYHPYDGGADVITNGYVERDILRERHGDWLSDHPMGL